MPPLRHRTPGSSATSFSPNGCASSSNAPPRAAGRFGAPTATTRALRRARDYLHDQAELNISLDELASVAGIGKFRLIRLFRERTGLTPHALQLAHRIRAARRLLEAGRTLAVVAATTGFADQSHLHRHFQRSLGMTPGEYRQRLHTQPHGQ